MLYKHVYIICYCTSKIWANSNDNNKQEQHFLNDHYEN